MGGYPDCGIAVVTIVIVLYCVPHCDWCLFVPIASLPGACEDTPLLYPVVVVVVYLPDVVWNCCGHLLRHTLCNCAVVRFHLLPLLW